MARSIDDLKVGDLAFNLNVGGFSRFHRRLVITKVTPKQIEGKDQLGRRTRYWLKNGYEVGGFNTNYITAGPPPADSKEPKHLIGKPDPKL